MDFRQKLRLHQSWVRAGKEFAAVMRKHKIHRLNDGLSTGFIEVCFADALPHCGCRDEGDRILGIVPKRIKGGQYQLRVLCVLCCEQGSRNLRWDAVGREAAIVVFANYFTSEGSHEARND